MNLPTRNQYDKRKVIPLYFTRDFTVNNSCLYLKGEEYSPYNWNYDRMIEMIKAGVLSESQEKDICENVIHHTCMYFSLYTGCKNCTVHEFESKY